MNTVRKLLQTNSEEIKEKLDRAYASIEFFQSNREVGDADDRNSRSNCK